LQPATGFVAHALVPRTLHFLIAALLLCGTDWVNSVRRAPVPKERR
jgi:predicted RNase H-like HicB family nuclease